MKENNLRRFEKDRINIDAFLLALESDMRSLEEGIQEKQVNLEEVKKVTDNFLSALNQCERELGYDPRLPRFYERASQLVEKRKSLGDWTSPRRKTFEENYMKYLKQFKDERLTGYYPGFCFMDEDGNIF